MRSEHVTNRGAPTVRSTIAGFVDGVLGEERHDVIEAVRVEPVHERAEDLCDLRGAPGGGADDSFAASVMALSR